MLIAKIQVSGIHAHEVYRKLIPAGIIGAKVEFEFSDPKWDELDKTVVFCGFGTKDVILDGSTAIIPAEVVSRKNVRLRVGIYGTDAENNLAIPTLWADLGVVRDAADPSGDTSTDPALPVWAQLQAEVEELKERSGGADPEKIKDAVAEYLEENPPEIEESDPTVPSWAKQPEKPAYTAQEVGADPAGTAATAVSQHNADTAAHNDLRVELKALADRINAVLDSDDETLDELSEIVAYIKSNKTLIDAITTSKVNAADIINDLTTNVANKPLSAAQGVVIKSLIEEVRGLIPTDDHINSLVVKNSCVNVTGATPGQLLLVKAVDENGKPTEWEAVDRTHWVEYGDMVEVIPERQLTPEEFSGINWTITDVPLLRVGETYCVEWNGVKYYCVGQDASSLMAGCAGVGNGESMGFPGNGEPFMLASYISDGTNLLQVFPLDGSENPTISIYQGGEIVHKLDNKYLDLTEAIDTALAQAKASGEFDGEDYVLTDADKSDIAEMAAGLVEVPESGGIAVTGATVGQTVKISEVDENGVPTAWEPVDFPSGGGGTGGGTKWEPLVNEVWQRNREFKFTEYDADTLTYTFPDGTFTDDEIGKEIFTRLCLDPNNLPNTHTNSMTYQTKLTPISENQATIPAAQVSALDGINYWFEIPTGLSIRGINARKIRVRWDGNVGRAFYSWYEARFAYGMPLNQAAVNIGYTQMYSIRSIADIELELIAPFVVSGYQNAYNLATSSSSVYHKKWFQSYSPVTTEVDDKRYYSSDGLLFTDLYWLTTPWLGDASDKFFIGNGTRIYVAREVEA